MENEKRNSSPGKERISAEQAEVIKNKILGMPAGEIKRVCKWCLASEGEKCRVNSYQIPCHGSLRYGLRGEPLRPGHDLVPDPFEVAKEFAAQNSNLQDLLREAGERIAFLESEPKSGISFEPGNVYGQMAAFAEPVAWQSIDGTVTNFPWIREAWKKDGIEYIPLYADSSVFLDQPPLVLYGWYSNGVFTKDAEVARNWSEGGVKYTTLFAYETGDNQPTDDAKHAPSTIVGLTIALEEACSAMRDACNKVRAFIPDEDEAEDLLIDVVSAVARSVVAANAFNAALPDGGGA